MLYIKALLLGVVLLGVFLFFQAVFSGLETHHHLALTMGVLAAACYAYSRKYPGIWRL